MDMKNNLFRKSLVIALIILFIGAGVVPCISGNVIKNENFIENTNGKNKSDRAARTVLGEFGTATWGSFPRYAHAALKEIYAEGQLDFYYVSLIYDVNPVADSYVHDYYNFIKFPILWWDGGYRVDLGAGSTEEAKEKYILSINSCSERDVYDVDIELDVDWLGGTEMQIDYTIYNNEPGKYDGTIKVYVIENESSEGWEDSGGNIYTMAFLDWAFYEEISIPAGETFSNTTTWGGESNGYPNITEENMIIIAAVFNDEWHQGYSDPPTGNPFDAYYADETVAVFPPFHDPPEKPLIDGPTIGADGVEYEYTLETTDPEDEDVYYYVEWGDETNSGWIGPYPSGEEVIVSHTWTLIGDYEIRAKAKDLRDKESEWSDVYPMTIVENEPPNKPDIDGSSSGNIGILYTYTFTSTDPDDNDVYYYIDWDDDTPEETIGPFQSGVEAIAKHRWTSQRTYTIHAKAIDIYSEESDSAYYEVKITKTRAVYTPFIKFLQSHLHTFPILRLLLQRLGLQ